MAGEVTVRPLPLIACLILTLMASLGSRQAYQAISQFGANRATADKTQSGHPPRHKHASHLRQSAVDQAPSTELHISLPPANNPTALNDWQQLETALSRQERQQAPILAAQLAESLRQQPDPDVYLRISTHVLHPNEPLANKAILLDLLTDTATPEALNQLLDFADLELDPSLSVLVLQSIARIGDNRWGGQFHEELSPTLEAAWDNPMRNDVEFLAALAKAIASIGAPKGVAQLLQTVSTTNTSQDSEATRRAKQEGAFSAIPQIRNPAAAAALAKGLEQEPIGSAAFDASGRGLASINSPNATQILIDYAKDAPIESSQNLAAWLPQINDEDSLKQFAATPENAFKNPEVGAPIQHAADKYRDNIAATNPVIQHGAKLK